jgi:bacteriorhodopsin
LIVSAASSNDFRAQGLSLAEPVVPRATQTRPRKEDLMFLILAVVLVVLWLGGFTLFHVTGFLIHLLLIFAVISLIMHFVGGGRRTV